MINLNLKSLIDKLSTPMKSSLEAAAAMAMSKANASVELEHWLLKLLEQPDTDLAAALATYKIDGGRLSKELLAAIEKFKSGHTRAPALAVELIDAVKLAWLIASVEHGLGTVCSAHLLAAALLDEKTRRVLCDAVPVLKDIVPESFREAIRGVVGKTAESTRHVGASAETSLAGSAQPASATTTPALDKYTVNLTERAAAGKIDPVLGRDAEIRQCIDILTRRRQNNPILTGEAGVGKTAVVEGLALQIAANDVPDPLKGVALRTLDLGLLQAGASVKGEFENRLRQVIDEVKAAATPTILFIDEAHTLIGAGGKEGQGDAANLLKPALARGELRTIAATTWAEYKKYFERDPALTRRFQVVKVEEPDEATAIEMMRGLSAMLQNHHRVRIADDAIKAAVTLSHRYIPGRQLPDKSVSLLDTACARVALSMSSTPALIEDAKRTLVQLDRNISRLELEHAASGTQAGQIEALRLEKADAEQALQQRTEQWLAEQALVKQILDLRSQLEAAHQQSKQDPQATSADTIKELQDALREQEESLRTTQGDTPLMTPLVDRNAVADVVANWTGIPVNKMLGSEIQSVLNLADSLKQRVIGQDHALESIAQAIRASRAGLNDPRKPLGVFLMVGTSGVGKTETALAVADMLFGGEHSITVINMSEFKEEHKVSMLLGSPPGYVGYGEGGVLTEAARRKPYSVILLDEMEKAHPGVQDIFYNLFDKGTIKDGEGRDIDFKNTLIIMTTNAGEDAIRAIMATQETRPDPEVLTDSIRPELLRHFKPAFLGRCSLVTYFPLEDEQLMKICEINLNRIAKRLRAHYDAAFSYDEDVALHIVARCQEGETGARNLESIISRTLLPDLASHCLTRLGNGESIQSVHITVSEDGQFGYQLG